LDWIYLLGGLVALFVGGEALVRGAVGIARALAMPPLLIGLTVVGFGTSTPELLVSVDAAWRGVPDIAIGNILLIVGLSALVWPIRPPGGTLRRDLAVMVAAALALIPLFWLGELGRLAGAGLVAGLAAYLVWAYRSAAGEGTGTGEGADSGAALPPWQAGLWVALGLAGLMLGARFLVDGAVNIARGYGVSEAFIGLSIVAVGTSLPELATSLIAAIRRNSDIAIGNIVGSNIFNVLGILGVTALVAPIPAAGRFLGFDLPVMLAASVALAGLLLARPAIGRGAGLALLVAYAAYLWAAQG
jgi:cation:H+ antiporter